MKRIDLRLPFGPPLTTEQFGAAIGLSRRSVLEAIDAGELRAVRIPPRRVQYRIPWDEACRYAVAIGILSRGGVFLLKNGENGENGTEASC